MDRKLLFDETVDKYERRRPNYGTQIYEDIIHYAGLDSTKSVIEIGCGTGQATLPFLKAGCKVTAVEIGTNLAAYTLKKYKDYENLRMINLPFEQFNCADNSFDMLYSATAFHWITAEIGYAKALSLLKHGGTLALFWNRPNVNNPDDALHQQIQAAYRELLPQWGDNGQPKDKSGVYEGIDNAIKAAGFADLQRKLYHNTRIFTGREYVELLDTYSDHRALDDKTRMALYNAVKAAIEAAGDILTVYDTVDLHLAKKP